MPIIRASRLMGMRSPKVFIRMPRPNGYWAFNPRIHGVTLFRRNFFRDNEQVKRMNTEQLQTFDLYDLNVEFDERPSMPALGNVTEAEHRAGLHLAAIHRMHLRDMQRLAHILEQVEQGGVLPEVFASEVSNVELTRNMRIFGTMCGRECQVLTFHHDAEEHMMFPQLEQQNIQALTRVVDRLKQEHLIVHELITRLETAAQALVQNPDEHNFARTKATFAQLHTVVISHFGYEETELREALGRFVPVM